MNLSYMTVVKGCKARSFLITQRILKKPTCLRTLRKASSIFKLQMPKGIGIQKKHLDHLPIGSYQTMKSINLKKAKRGNLNQMRTVKVTNKSHQQRLSVDQLRIIRANF